VLLYVLRHGVAEDRPERGGDFERKLTDEGRVRLVAEAAGLHALGVAPTVMLASPLPRAAETAAIVAAGLKSAPDVRETEALAPGISTIETLRALDPLRQEDEVMVVGHEPGLSRLVAQLLTGSPAGLSIKLKKGGCVAVEVSFPLTRSSGMLRWALTPRALRLLGGG